MKTILILLAVTLLTGCFAPLKTHEALHEKKTFYPSGELASHEVRRDRSKGGGIALFSDPKASQLSSDNRNQTALGGGSRLNVGELSGTARPDAITATGGAAGTAGNALLGGPRLPGAPDAVPATPTATPVVAEKTTTEPTRENLIIEGVEYLEIQAPHPVDGGVFVYKGPDGGSYVRSQDGKKMIRLPE